MTSIKAHRIIFLKGKANKHMMMMMNLQPVKHHTS